jgi:DNA repair protein RadC
MGIHSGHRERVKSTYLKFGPEVFDDYKLLELFLFYSNPRSDVNPLAHQLINHFGSLQAVLSAPVEQLCAMEGVGQHTAISLHLVSDPTQRCQQMRTAQRSAITSPEDAAEYFGPYFFGAKTEQVYLACLDSQGRILHCHKLCEGGPNSAAFDLRNATAAALASGTTGVILAHNHLSGSTEPSQADLDATRSVAAGLRVIQVELLDHLILADADFLSLRQSGFLDWNNL